MARMVDYGGDGDGESGVSQVHRAGMTRVLVVAFVLLAAPICAQDRPRWYDASEAVAVIGHSADLASTQFCLGQGRCHETNPYLLRFSNPTGFAVAKMSVASLGLWATRKIQNKKLGAILNYGIGAGFAALALRNERIGRGVF